MKKKVISRICEICGTKKRTTNTETPYIGEECYKTLGRELLLQTTPSGSGFWKGAVILVVTFVIGIILGVWLF